VEAKRKSWTKSRTIGFVVILLATNLLTAIVATVVGPEVRESYYMLKMKGQGEYWLVQDYQFAWAADRGVIHGSETVTYLGRPEELTGDIVVKVYDYFEGGAVPHQTSTVEASKLKEGSFKAGGGGAYPEERLSVQDIVESTRFHIAWTTADGQQHEEMIQAELDADPMIANHMME